MLVIVSDLHFSDGTAGSGSLAPGAFETFLGSDVIALARRARAREVKLVLLGDILDLLRSEQWLEKDGVPFPLVDRPWGANGIADVAAVRAGSATEARCLDILGRLPADRRRRSAPAGSILRANWQALRLFREFGRHVREQLGEDIAVDTVYVPGNHDRLVNVYPAVRDAAARMLGIDVGAAWLEHRPDGGWRFPVGYMDEAYGVIARHGHQYDRWNFAAGAGLGTGAHLQPPVGDVIAAELVVKFPWLLSKMRDRWNGITDALVDGLRVMHNVRPTTHVIDWLRLRIADEHQSQLRKALDAALTAVTKELLDIEFLHCAVNGNRRWDLLRRTFSRPLLRSVSKRAVEIVRTDSLLPLVMSRSMLDAAGGESLAMAARSEPALLGNPFVRFVVYGHTHAPMQAPLHVAGDREAVYINTGTWQERVVRTLPDAGLPGFVALKNITYAVFYRADEDTAHKVPGTASFDVWTGTRMKAYAAPEADDDPVAAACAV